MKENFIKVALSICICLIAFPFLAKGQLPFSPCSPSGGKRADVLGFETKYRAPGGTAPTFTIPTGTKSIAVYVSSETGITTGTSDYDQGDEDFITINAIIDVGNKTSSGYVNYAKNTNTDGSGTNVYGWKNVALGDTIPQASKIGDALPYLNNVKFSISGSTLTIQENATATHSSYYVEYLSPYNNSLSPLDPQIRALLHGTTTTNTDLSIPIPAGAEIVFISGKGTNSSYTDLNSASGTEEGYANMRFGLDLTAGTLNGFVTLANGGSVTRRSTYVISNKATTATSDMVSSGKISGDYTGKLTTDGAVGLYNPRIYVSNGNLIIKRDANYARDFDDAYVVEFYSRVGLGMSTEFIDSDISAILDGSYTWGAKRTFTIPSGTNFIYFNETGNAVNTDRESNENSLAAYGYIDLSAKTVTGYFYQQVGLSGTTRRDDNYAFKNVPLDSTSTRTASGTVGFKNSGAVYDISFFLSSDKSQLTVINKTGLANPSYQFLLSCDYYGSRPDVAFSTAAGITFTKGSSCNIVKATVNVCNPGSGNSSGGMPVSFYSGDPTTDPAAILLYTGTFNQDIPQGECRSFDFNLDLSSFSNVNIPLSMVLNDNGSFVSGGVGHAVGTPFTLASLANQNSKYKECYYDNNLISSQIAVNNCPVVNLDLDSSSGATAKNFINYFAAGSATGANIADNDVTVTDPDGDNISSAKIVLTNDKNGSSEYLIVNGTMPSGITVSGANTDTIRLSGVASAAAYAEALKLIQYMNTLGTPNTTTRTITVEVNDGKETGPSSTTSIYILTTPMVSVSGNGQTIADNRTTTSTTDGTNYGVLTSTGGALGHSFTVQNIGTGTITLTNTPIVTISGDTGFTVSSQPSGTSLGSGSGLGFVVTFNPASHAIGTYTAVVTIKNNDSNPDRATYSFTVSAVVNNLPTVSDNSVSGPEDAALAFTAANFTSVYNDPDGTALSKVKILSLPLNGSFKLNGTNITVGQEIVAADLSKIVFTPTANWNGTTSFQWNGSDGTSYATTAATMTINITPVNDAPTMSLPTGLAVTEDTPASLKDVSFADVDAGTGTVSATFTVPTGWFNTATLAGVTVTGSGGSVTLSGTVSAINSYISGGNLTYSASHTPPASETITVTVSDNGNTGAGGTKTASGTISLGITAVNDIPYGPDTHEEINQDTELDSKVTATDLDGEAITFTKATNPAHGTVTVNSDGTYKYIPATGYVGTDVFTVTVSDGHSSSIITVNITVKKVNHAPVATDDAVTVVEDVEKGGNVLTNDTDADGDALTASLITAPVHGTVVLNADGSYTYTPDKDFNGLDSLKYQVCDNGVPSMCDTGTVMLTVTAVNDAPVAVNDSVTVVEDTDGIGNVLTNDTDVEGDALTASLVTAPVHGTVVLNSDGSFTYTPNQDFNGQDSLKYRVCDNGTPSMCDTGTVIFTVTAVNDAPVAVNDAVTVNEDTDAIGNVLTNDTDPEGNALTASLITAPVHGTVVLNADGSFTYTPNQDFNGLDSLKYRVCDNGTPSMCDTGTVIFTVTAVNDAPVAVNDAVTVNEDTDAIGNVLTNDTDPEGNALTVSLITAPVHGTVVLNADGSFTYTPNQDFNGQDSLKYRVCDNGSPSMCDTGTVIFTVTAVNDAPVAVNDAVTVNEDTDAIGNVLTNDTDPEGNALTASLITAPVHGTVVLNADGSFTYTPNQDFNGLDSLKYRVCDNGTPSMCDTGTVIFTVTAVNDAPVAVNDAVTVNEDTDAIGNVLTNDTDPEGDALTASLVTAPVHGTVVLNADGSFTYTPNQDFNGLDSLKYRVCDNGTPSMCDTGTVIFTVTAVNDVPVAVNDAVTVNEDTDAIGNVLTNDTDPEGNALTASLITAPVHGTVVLNADGSFTYTPNQDFNGLDSLKYRVCDNGTPSMCDTGTVIFTVTAVNDAPVAVNDAVTVNEDTDAIGNVLTNDTDPEGNALTASLITAPVHGTVVLNADGSFTYTPNQDFNGLDSLKYRVCDNGTPSMCDTGTVIFTVTAVNDAPVAVNDAVTVNEDTDAIGNVLTNDTDPEGNALTASLITTPVHGTVVLNADGSFTYTPNQDFNGLDSLKYRVCDNGTPSLCDTGTVIFTVTAVNDAPAAVNDAVTVNEDTDAIGNVLTNDTDPEGNALTASLITAPVHGSVVLNADGSFTYTPNQDFNGQDSLKYRVCDNGSPSMCDTGTVIFTVTAVNDAPVAVNDAVTVNEDTDAIGNVLTNDTDPEGNALTASQITAPVHGTVVLNSDGSFTYTPNQDFNGQDSLKYRVCDNGTPSMCDTGTVTFTVTAVNDAPVAVNDAVTVNEDTDAIGNVLTNDTDPEGNALTASLITAPVHGTVVLNADGSFTYTPNQDFNGQDSLKYKVCDNGTPSLCDTGTVIFTVTAVNDAPVAVNDAVTVNEDTDAIGNVLTNDTDPEGNALTASLITAPVHGTVVLNADGSFTYTPNQDFNGLDSLKYRVCDNGTPSMCDTGTVIFTVTAVNDAPVAVNDAVTLNEDNDAIGNVLTNDTDPDGDALTASLVTAPVHGTVVLNGDGSFTYTPNKDFNGLDSLKYKVCDNGTPSLCDTAVVKFTIAPVNDEPVVTGGNTTTTEQNKPVKDTLVANDPDGDPLTYSKGDDPDHGSVVVDGDGTYTYTPTPGYTGNDTFTIIVDDGTGNPKTVTVTVTVTPPTTTNNPPVVTGGYDINTEQDKPVIDTLVANDPDGDPLTYSKGSDPAHGSVNVNTDGTYTYTPEPGYTGTDTFTIIVDDGHGDPKTVTVTVTVTPPNKAPVITGGETNTTEQGKPVSGTVTATDPDGDPITFEKGNDPAHGTVVVNTDGTYTYTPEPGYTGDDTFTIIVKDDKGNETVVTVDVTVTPSTPPNQAPVITGGETNTTEQGKPVSGTVTATDPDGDPITFEKGNDPAHGTVVVNADGTYTYTPQPGYTGDDTFTIIVKDDKGNETEVTVDVTVTPSTPPNQAPVITGGETTSTEQGQPVNGTVTATDPDGDPITFEKGNDPAHGTVVVNADGTYTYTPEPGYTGNDTFTIIVKDDKGNETEVTVNVTVTPPNQAPVVTGGETLTTEQDKPGTGTMTATDPEGGPLTFEKGGDPAHGSVVVNADGTYTYTPEPGYTGNDTFTIIVKDDKGKTTTVAVSVTVTPDNSNNPVAVDDSITVIANTPLDIDVLANDSAGTSTFETGSITIIDQPAHGSVVVNSNGTVTYTPATGYTGDDTFTYQVKTADGKTTNTATVRISASFAEITVPTLFTPNGDGRNDVFEIRGLSQYAETELIIVNRWGNEVYRQKNYQNTWKGDGLNEGTYFYLLRIKRTASSGWEVIKGYTTLVRNFNN